MRLKKLRTWRYPEPTPRYVWAIARVEYAIRYAVWRLQNRR